MQLKMKLNKKFKEKLGLPPKKRSVLGLQLDPLF